MKNFNEGDNVFFISKFNCPGQKCMGRVEHVSENNVFAYWQAAVAGSYQGEFVSHGFMPIESVFHLKDDKLYEDIIL